MLYIYIFLMSFINENDLSESQNKSNSILDDSKFSSRQNEASVSIEKKIYNFKVVLLGDASVGKTSIINRYVKKQFSNDNKCTISTCIENKSFTYDLYTIINLNIWDTSGEERYKSLTQLYFRDTHGIVLNYDINNRKTFESLNEWLKIIKENVNKYVSIIIVGNKSDLERNVSKEELNNYCQNNDFISEEVSAKNGINIDLLFQKLSKKMIENFENFEKEDNINNNNNIDNSEMNNYDSKIKLSNSMNDDNKRIQDDNIEKKKEKEIRYCC